MSMVNVRKCKPNGNKFSQKHILQKQMEAYECISNILGVPTIHLYLYIFNDEHDQVWVDFDE